MDTSRELAELAIKTLDGQQKYFRNNNKSAKAELLNLSKKNEAELRKAASDVLKKVPASGGAVAEGTIGNERGGSSL
jgi:hypothetical protein